MRRSRRQGGFTLIEIMMAMAIMAISFAAILTTQSSSIIVTTKIRDMNIAGMLAHNLMVESEHLMEGKAFSELKDAESDAYKPPFERFKWKREVKEIKFPDFGMFASGGEEGSQQGQEDKSRVLGQAVTKFLSEGMRELVVTVSWPVGDGEQKVTLTTYLVNMDARFNFAL